MVGFCCYNKREKREFYRVSKGRGARQALVPSLEGYLTMQKLLPEKNFEQTVWMTLSFGGCFSFTKCLGTSGWKVNGTRLYGLFQRKISVRDRTFEKVVLFFFFCLDGMF